MGESYHANTQKTTPPAAFQAVIMQLELFKSRLSKKPHCTDYLGSMQIRTAAHAVKRRYIQPNEPLRRHWLVFDVDYEGACEAWRDVCAEPQLTVINPNNAHAHLLYCLDVPIYLMGNASLKPAQYASAVYAAYLKRLGADPGYSEKICKNPLHSDWKVLKGPAYGYDLDELASWVSPRELRNAKKSKEAMEQGWGRNVSLFNTVRTWAYRSFNGTPWLSFDAWHRAVEAQTQQLNGDFPDPLPFSEVKTISKSVAMWIWKNFDSSTFSDIQAARGRKSGAKRRKGSIQEQQPWVELGVSRATWYRRQQQKTLFDSGTEQ